MSSKHRSVIHCGVQALQNIKMGTGISDVGVLVQSFAVAEQKNLDLLARVSDLNGTAQVRRTGICVLRCD